MSAMRLEGKGSDVSEDPKCYWGELGLILKSLGSHQRF